ncbi:MAG: sigma 54-interacting transcriptional regulator [Planctomycetota bacterium]
MTSLRIIEGHRAGFVIPLTSERMTIGRDPTNPIQIGDAKASRIHAEVYHDDAAGGWHLRDLGSFNGTWTESGRIETLALEDGCTFRIGSTYLQVIEDAGADEPAATFADLETGWHEPVGVEALGGQAQLFTAAPAADPAQLARSNEYLMMLHQVVRRSNACSARDELFDLLDDIAAEALEGDRCAVFLPAPEGWALWPPHERRLRARFGATPFAGSLLRAPRLRTEPLLCTRDGDLSPSPSMVRAGVASAMAAPMRVGEVLHALLYVDRLDGEEPFGRRDLEFLAAVANQIAVALSNLERVGDLAAEVERLSPAIEPETELPILGDDPAMDQVRACIERCAPTDTPVLIRGPSGSGKHHVARAIHLRSLRAAQPLQVATCTALTGEAGLATLFGEAGAKVRPGLFELADTGTVFLDEIAHLPAAAQALLLRLLEHGEVQRRGESGVRRVDVRVIAASSQDLDAARAQGNLRDDLYHRLAVVTVALPPVRDRPKDVELLLEHFLVASARRLDVPVPRLSPEARTILLRYDWPGNVRQLRITIEQLVALCHGATIGGDDIPQSIRGAGPGAVSTPLTTLAEVEKAHILRVLDHFDGNKKASAQLLGIDRSTLYAKLRNYGMI